MTAIMLAAENFELSVCGKGRICVHHADSSPLTVRLLIDGKMIREETCFSYVELVPNLEHLNWKVEIETEAMSYMIASKKTYPPASQTTLEELLLRDR